MLRSFRSRLIAGFALVILLSLFLSATGYTWLLREQQVRAEEQRIGMLVGPVTEITQRMEGAAYPRERMRYELQLWAAAYDVRILLLDAAQRVVLDTHPEQRLLGGTLNIADEPEPGAAMVPSFRAIRHTAGGDDLYLFTQQHEDPSWPAAAAMRASQVQVVIAVPAADVIGAWAKLLPRLLLAGTVAGAVGVVVSSLLASRITNPIGEMTRASQAMARGDLRQRIEVDGNDEVATLATAFNEMSDQVSRSNRAMRDLLANVSHELKTPLTSIQGFSQALVDGMAEGPEDYAEMGAVIHAETERVRAMVEDLLYLSAIESGALQLALEDGVDIDAIVVDAAKRFRLHAETEGVGLTMELEGATVRADGRRLEQVLANLVDNAIRFAPAGTEVVIRTRAARDEVRVSVTNGGDPIPSEDLPFVFDRFYQVDRARSERSERSDGGDGRHSGLGLSIVRELVQAHGGTVEVTSNAWAGTTFTVRLPAGGPGGSAAPASAEPGAQARSWRPMRPRDRAAGAG